MNKSSKIFVAGGSGMVGYAIIRKLLSAGFNNIISTYHNQKPFTSDLRPPASTVNYVQLDLTRQTDVETFFDRESPEHVFLAAAKVGGILANNKYPAQFIYENMIIQNNVIHKSYKNGVKRLLFLGSSCVYPKLCPQPIKEEYLLTRELEPTNEPYAVAKIAGIKMCQSYNRQYGTNFISVMPTNLYGSNDNFNLETSHVLPAMIRKFHEAKLRMEQTENKGKDSAEISSSTLTSTFPHPEPVVLWGSGLPRREFLHVDDLADACLFLMEKYDGQSTPDLSLVNIGAGRDITIKELAELIKDIVGFEGGITWDTTKPDGTPRKLLDVSRLKTLGWEPKITLKDGIRKTYEWYLSKL
ncbi:MAG: GDP-L-fucose synthase, partial [Thermodesulfobacteriota bacterium]